MKTWQVTVISPNGPVSHSFKAASWDTYEEVLLIWSDDDDFVVFGTRIELLQSFQVISE